MASMKTPTIMWAVAAALLLPLAGSVYVYGIAALMQTLLAVSGCVASEACCLRYRQQPIAATLGDGSAVIAGMIIGLSVPPAAPWHIALSASVFAMCLAKHCYGGLGNNPFNPAMAGYALAFVSFPADFSGWHVADWTTVFIPSSVDAVSAPTPLLAARLQVSAAAIDYIVPLACVFSGSVMLWRRVADWRLTVSFLAGALLVSGGDVQLIVSGGLALAAFFVVTDPVSAAASVRGRWLYGLLIGALAIFLRRYGAHADAIAFAVLIGNMVAPFIDKALLWRR